MTREQENGFILWTSEQGGFFKAMKGTRAEYEQARESGVLRVRRMDLNFPTTIATWDEWPWYFIGFGNLEDTFDRGLQDQRQDLVFAR